MFPIEPTAGTPLLPPLHLLGFFSTGLALALLLIFLIIHFRSRKLTFVHKLREFLVWTILLFVGILAFAGYVFLPAPRVLSANPSPDSKNVDLKSAIVIQFDKPVSRRVLEKSISPEVPGTWVFEDELYTTHFYRRVVFYPEISLDSGKTYTITLKGIENTLQTSDSLNYSFSFTTKVDTLAAKEIKKVESETVKLAVPVHLQQHTLSCEVASLKMALAYKGIEKSEEDLLAQVGVDNTPHTNGLWGNPYEAFVGNVDGTQMKNGYGVYWGPIERVAKNYGGAKAFQNGTVQDLTREIRAGNPVIIWTYSKNGTPTKWKTPQGVEVYAVAGEHTIVVVGYVGSAASPDQIIVNDSLVGQSYWALDYFNKKWAVFSQSGVVIYK